MVETISARIEENRKGDGETPTLEQVLELIREDSFLPDHITARPDQTKTQIRNISNVLLTGVTGTLGPYVLRELSKNIQISQIVCIVRPKKNLTANERLYSILTKREILSEVDISKVIGVPGNVAFPNLGLEPSIWEELIDSVDAVFHCAAGVQHMELYRKSNNPNSMRAVNIGGLKNILEFCCSGQKLKQIYNASSLLAVTKVDELGNYSENWPQYDEYSGGHSFAYPISKFVGDIIMKEVINERGIPGKVFRFPFISGDSRNGRFVLSCNHLMLRYLSIMKMGIMPNVRFPVPILPVDVCAQLSVDIFFNPEALDDVYNITNCKPCADQDFVTVAKHFGHPVELVSFSEFVQKIGTEDTPLKLFKGFYENEDHAVALFTGSLAFKQWAFKGAQRDDFFFSKKVATLMPEFYTGGYGRRTTMDYIFQDLSFAQQHGWLEKFGL